MSETRVKVAEISTAQTRPWLDEVIARFGKPRVHAGPAMSVVANPDFPGSERGVAVQRECWVWFPDLKNWNLALDHYERKGYWMITANAEWGKKGHAAVRIDGTEEPAPAAVRAALVAAGFLEG